MGDQTTPPRPSNRIQTSEDRDLAARRRPRSYPLGVAIPPPAAPADWHDAGEVTSPYDLLEREPDHEVNAVVEKATRNAKDPAYFEDVAKLAVALSRERSGNRQRERDADDVLREPARAARSSRRHLIAAVVAAAASIGGALEKCSSPPPAASSANADAIRVQFQHEIDRLDAEILQLRTQLGQRSERAHLVPAGASPALTVTTKGTNP